MLPCLQMAETLFVITKYRLSKVLYKWTPYGVYIYAFEAYYQVCIFVHSKLIIRLHAQGVNTEVYNL